MEQDGRGVVIKPPMEDVTAGRVFKPDRRFYYKEWIGASLVAVIFWLMSVGGLLFGSWIYASDHGGAWTTFYAIVVDVFPMLCFWYVISMVFWWLPIMVGIPLYVRNIRYSVISKSGTTMPEIFVQKGLFNITKKHVPFRTITNIASRAGPIDRALGIGTVEIQTAGYSGGTQAGSKPEEKIEGVVFYEEVRDYILQELRRFRDPYVTGTEVVLPQTGDNTDNEILITLREIRDVLGRIDRKLDEER
ncbi:MAG: PH domain-containing protein [Promethearchaeota archaeon]